jgi:vacuolar-type H+-ATPase subunit C/Vma6
MTKREKELLLLLAETDLKNLKIILRLKEGTASQAEIDSLLEKIWNVMHQIEHLKLDLNNE